MAYGSNWQRKSYYLSPPWGRCVVSSLYGWLERRHRYGDAFWSTLNQLKRLERASNESLLAYQFERLNRFLSKAADEVQYYREVFARNGFSPERFEHRDQLSVLPILDKETVRQQMTDLISKKLSSYSPRWVHTSGTTGKALQFPLSSFCFQREYAFRAHHYSWANVDLVRRQPKAFVAGHAVTDPASSEPPFWTYDVANNWLLFSSYHLSQRNLPAYVAELEKFSPVLIGGYPSSIALLAAAQKKWGSGRLNVKAVYTASETLLEYQRKLIESAFGCKVFVWYGNTEMCGHIAQCEQGVLHGRLEHSFMEVLDESGYPAREGALVCTGFGNSAFPLIRYNTGDVVKLSDDQVCGCGRGGILFESVIGRVEDYVVTPDDRLVGRLDHLFKDAIHVIEAQLLQADPSELVIRIVPRPEYTVQDESSIVSEARLRLGPEIKLRFEYVQALERTSNGKARFVISSINKSQLTHERRPVGGVFAGANQS
jgi:phenylacetate-CoA ligase